MLDQYARPLIDPPLNAAGKVLAKSGFTANGVTLIGLCLGLFSAVLIAVQLPSIALVFVLASRVADGLDGAIARATRKTDFGGYLDITADFLFYGAVPAAFVFADPVFNGAAGAFLLTAFYFNGASFLGYALLAEKRGDTTDAQGQKSLYYSNGLLEGTETIVFFALLCIFPHHFALLSYIFGGLCFVTAVLRLSAAKKIYTD